MFWLRFAIWFLTSASAPEGLEFAKVEAANCVRYGNAVELSNAGDYNTCLDAGQDRPANDGKGRGLGGKNTRNQLITASAFKMLKRGTVAVY